MTEELRPARVRAPKKALFGIQHAGWQPPPIAAEELGVRVLSDQSIPVADDISLNAEVYAPVVEGRYPAVVSSRPTTRSGPRRASGGGGVESSNVGIRVITRLERRPYKRNVDGSGSNYPISLGTRLRTIS